VLSHSCFISSFFFKNLFEFTEALKHHTCAFGLRLVFALNLIQRVYQHILPAFIIMQYLTSDGKREGTFRTFFFTFGDFLKSGTTPPAFFKPWDNKKCFTYPLSISCFMMFVKVIIACPCQLGTLSSLYCFLFSRHRHCCFICSTFNPRLLFSTRETF
jgi:hypothetical protein